VDPKENLYVDEFGTSNFIGITAEGEFHTPSSSSILESITNESLQTLAQGMGLKVVKKPIRLDELDRYVEVGACGTAAVITPIGGILHGDKWYRYGKPGQAGETLTRLYQQLQSIQYGDSPDSHGWRVPV
jgi:branched-chain amino acid aminotransferase